MPSIQAKTTASLALSAALLAIASTGFAADAPTAPPGAAAAATATAHCLNPHVATCRRDCAPAAHPRTALNAS